MYPEDNENDRCPYCGAFLDDGICPYCMYEVEEEC